MSYILSTVNRHLSMCISNRRICKWFQSKTCSQHLPREISTARIPGKTHTKWAKSHQLIEVGSPNSTYRGYFTLVTHSFQAIYRGPIYRSPFISRSLDAGSQIAGSTICAPLRLGSLEFSDTYPTSLSWRLASYRWTHAGRFPLLGDLSGDLHSFESLGLFRSDFEWNFLGEKGGESSFFCEKKILHDIFCFHLRV